MAAIFSKNLPLQHKRGMGLKGRGINLCGRSPFPAPKRLTARHIAWTGLRCRRGFFEKSRSSAAKLLNK